MPSATAELPTPASIPPAAQVAVTGATGFIGRQLCYSLVEQGFHVRALVRAPEHAASLARAGVELIRGDLATGAAIQHLLSDSTAIIHCAGSVRGRTFADFAPANVDGVKHLCAALRSYPRCRLLALSSLAAREPGLSPYAASKRAGEEVLLDSGVDNPWTILRPPAVYGPGDRELLPLFRLMARGLAPVPGQLRDRVSLLYVGDLITAVMAWLRADRPPAGIFTLSDPTDAGYSWQEILAIAGAEFGRNVRRLPLPAMALNAVARVNWLGATVLGYAPMLTPAKLRELRHPDWVCGWRALAAALDWQPRVALAEGLRLTLRTKTAIPGTPRS